MIHVMPTCVVQVFYHSKFTLEFFCGINYVIISLVIYMLERSKMIVSEDKINKLRILRKENNYNYLISIDGGINNETIDKSRRGLLTAAANFLLIFSIMSGGGSRC